MKTWLKWQRLLPVLAISALMFCVACIEPVPDPPTNPDPPPTEEDPGEESEAADAFLSALVFANSAQLSGQLPNATNTDEVKMNVKDTIYLMEGVKIPLRFSHPENQPIAGIYIAVNHSTFYFDVPINQEEESDTVAIVFVDIDPDTGEFPLNAPAKIIPYDENDQPIDVIQRIITIEEPATPGCDILVAKPGTLGDTTGFWSPEWFWHHTIAFNSLGEPTFVNAPGLAHVTETMYEGCCDYDDNKNCNILSTELNETVNAKISYTIMSETFSFFTDGTFARQSFERKTNFDPETTQWCSNSPGYKHDDVVVTYRGTHDYVPGGTSISLPTDWASCDLCGYGSPGGTLTFSCHMLVISRNNGSQIRVYVRSSTSEWFN